jgi:uncharacterized protein (DUF1330 family)
VEERKVPKGYAIFTEAIRDEAGMVAYRSAAPPSTVLAGAAVLAVDRSPQLLEGEWHGDRTVILEFESVAAARAWYDSAAYQRVKPLRQAAADTNAVIVAGVQTP